MERFTAPHTDSEHPNTVPPFSHFPKEPHHTEEARNGFFTEVIRLSVIALVIVLPIRLFIAQPFIVSGASMEQTFEDGEYLIVDQISYRFEEPERGDVIVFRYPKDNSKFFIKRIIGVPGDTVHIEGSTVFIKNTQHPEGLTLEEPYVRQMSPSAPLTETLGPQEYFVMGDNRNASSDSRVWGVLPQKNIVGRAFLRLFPISELGLFPGKYDFNDTFITYVP